MTRFVGFISLTRRQFVATLAAFSLRGLKRLRGQAIVAAKGRPNLHSAMREALERNAKALKTITISWERTRTSDLPEPKLLATVGYPDWGLDLLMAEKAQVKWDDGAYCVNYHRKIPVTRTLPNGRIVLDTEKRLEDSAQEIAYDGKTFYNGSPGDAWGVEPSVIHVDPPAKLVKDRAEWTIFPRYFHEAGFKFPKVPADLASNQYCESLVTFLVDKSADSILNGVSKNTLNSTAVEIVDITIPDGRVRFYLDPSKNYAVVRREETTRSGLLAVRADCFNFVNIQNTDAWLPKRVAVEWHTWDPQPKCPRRSRCCVKSTT